MLHQEVIHPRPQLARPRWIDLSGLWGFAFDDDDIGLDQGWQDRPDVFDRSIEVPFPPESRASGIGDPRPHPVVWYRRTFHVDQADTLARLLLHFGAVDYRAKVWVNGQFVAHHEGGHTPFFADIAPLVRGRDEHIVVVRAEDHPTDLAQPRGKQDWEPTPHRIWYHRTTGIWQPVWLEPVPETYISEIRWTPDLDRGLVGLQVRLNQSPRRTIRLRIRLSLRGEVLVDDDCAIDRLTFHREFALELGGVAETRRQLLWSPRRPNLLDAELSLVDGDEVIDGVESYLGLRSCGFANGRFLLNGQPYYLRLVLGQNYWPESHLAAPSADSLRREVEAVKALGFNGVRIHQKVEDPRFLYWCDRLGLLVWGEMANAYIFTTEAVERLTREWLEMLRRDYSHPSIVTWVPINESWGVSNLDRDPAQRAYVRALYHLTHALDSTRPVIGNDGWEHVVSDVWGIHDYALNGETLRERYGTPEAVERTLRQVQPHYRTIAYPDAHRKEEPIMLTEFGGISYAPASGEPWHGYGTVTTPEEFAARYEDLVTTILDSPTIAGFCYTQLTDTEQETNGLLTADRTPKLDPEVVSTITRRPSKAVPGEILTNIQVTSSATPFEGSTISQGPGGATSSSEPTRD